MTPFSKKVLQERYFAPGERSWEEVVNRCINTLFSVSDHGSVLNMRNIARHMLLQMKCLLGGRILRGCGMEYHQLNNCFLLQAEDTRRGWGQLCSKAATMLMSGGGIGVDYRHIRPEGTLLKTSGGYASGPIPLIRSINELGRGVHCGGFRRSAIYASLPWDHADIEQFIQLKAWPEYLKKEKALDTEVAAPCDLTNISVALNQEFFDAYLDVSHSKHALARKVYYDVVNSMCENGEPGFQVDLDDQTLRNACTEIISRDDSDVCVLGHANFGRISAGEIEEVAATQALLLLLATEYSQTPTPKSKRVQRRNRRLGAGIMGIGEWFAMRGFKYGDLVIEPWVAMWAESVKRWALHWAGILGYNEPVATRAIAPTGTTSIVAETSSGIEPLIALAYERRVLVGKSHNVTELANGVVINMPAYSTDVIVDPVAQRLIELHGIAPDQIETAYDIEPSRRVAFQAMVQSYLDNGISSTINMAPYATGNNKSPVAFGNTLIHHLPKLRGITVFPNGSRGLQPIKPIDYYDAVKRQHVVEGTDEACPTGVCAL